jgi:hypothetical protein
VCKAFLSKCIQDAEHPYFPPNKAASDIWKENPVNVVLYKGAQSVYRVKESDAKQRLWFVFDNALVLPEYLVEFEYIPLKRDLRADSLNMKSLSWSTEDETKALNKECNYLFEAVNQTGVLLEDSYLSPSAKQGLPNVINDSSSSE